MAFLEMGYLTKTNLMEGFLYYLNYLKKASRRTNNYINIIRKFHNHIGKPYASIYKEDVQEYLYYLKDIEDYKYESLNRHLIVIKMFYNYLIIRGEILNNPCNGLRFIKY